MWTGGLGFSAKCRKSVVDNTPIQQPISLTTGASANTGLAQWRGPRKGHLSRDQEDGVGHQVAGLAGQERLKSCDHVQYL